MAKYSKEQRDRAVDLYIRYERCAADVIHELGYPSRGMLPVWYRERLEEERTGRQSTRGKRYRRYTDEQKQAAVDHYLGHGRRLKRTMRALGYPKSHELLTAWIDELAPGRRKLRHGPVPEELKRKAVVAVASGRPESREAAAELGVEASVVGKLETADARRIQGDARDEDTWREAPDGRGGENRRGALYAGGHAAGRRRPAGRGRSGGRGGGAGEEAGGDACPSGRAGRRRRSAAAGEEGTGHRDRDPEGRDRAVGKRAGRSPGKPGHSTSRQGSPSDRMSSCRVMPSVSPSLMPVMNRSHQMSRHFVSGSRAMSRAACPVVRMAISTGSVSGTSVRAAGFRSMSPSAMASPRAVLRMLWVRRAVAAERGSVPVRPSPRRMRFSTMRTWLGRSRSSGTAPMTGVMSMRMRVR